MANTASGLLKRLQRMLPTIPHGPPIPRKEIVALLRQLQKHIDTVIKVIERSGDARTAPKRRKPRARKAKPAAAA